MTYLSIVLHPPERSERGRTRRTVTHRCGASVLLAERPAGPSGAAALFSERFLRKRLAQTAGFAGRLRQPLAQKSSF
jgi:hypothetical protein